jgi:hypothetical protein
MICAACGLNWDTDDPEPPECQKVDRRSKKAKSAKEGLEASFAHAKERRRVPEELPDHVAAAMVKAYHANARDGLKGRVAGMQAAWRVFLDTVEV